jgi:hypothetical protein
LGNWPTRMISDAVEIAGQDRLGQESSDEPSLAASASR